MWLVILMAVLSGVRQFFVLYFLEVSVIWFSSILTNVVSINPLKSKPLSVIFKNLYRTTRKILYTSITKMNLLVLIKEIIAVYAEHHMKPMITECTINDC